MPLVSALAASHAPNILLEPGREWEDFMDLHYSMAPQGSVNRPTLEQQKKLRQDAETAFATLRADLEQAKPDVLIVVANDQFVNFFWNNIPTFFVTIAERVQGQFTRHKFDYQNHKELGKAIIRAGGFGDFADKKKIKLTRKSGETVVVNLKRVIEDGRTDEDVVVQPDDQIYVPQRLVNF